jgi:hypothetical protein
MRDSYPNSELNDPELRRRITGGGRVACPRIFGTSTIVGFGGKPPFPHLLFRVVILRHPYLLLCVVILRH